jgi:aminoglycoside phosphotransferase (APT) family kinase protein
MDFMIPEEKKDAVIRGLSQAFGVTEFDDISMLTRGLSSALVFRIVVRRRPYLLRIITRTDAMNDPTRQFACMQAASEAGLAPHVWYTSIEDRISITDFVEAVPFPISDALVRIPCALRILHALPPFAQPVLIANYLEAVDRFIRRFQAANILPESETEEVFNHYAQLTAVYPREDSEMVASHNDLKPENILFDGDRVWMVDWEAAFLNDRYHDLAVVANFVVLNEEDERAYLQDYFGQAPDDYQRARFFLMRQVSHMSYATVFLLLGLSGRPLNPTEPAPQFRDFHQRIWAGDVSLADSDMKIAYGRTHWNQLSQNVRTVRFREALRIISERHARGVSSSSACAGSEDPLKESRAMNEI